MCGRYASSRTAQDLVEDFGVVESWARERLDDHGDRDADRDVTGRGAGGLGANYNVAPTDEVYIVAERRGRDDGGDRGEHPERQLRTARWGLVPSWAKDPSIGSRMINARMETLAERPAYRTAFAKRRCLVPADGYYEWYATERVGAGGRPVKQPYFIRPKDHGVLAMAGLYEFWSDPAKAPDDPTRWLWSCTVVTTAAEDALGRIHDRMPLMVAPERWEEWLDPARPGTTDLLTPAMPGLLEAYPVATLVNNVRNDGPELIAPLPLEEVAR